MASQSAIATPHLLDGKPVVSADSLNYRQKEFSHSSYRFNPQYSNTFGANVNLSASQTPVTINIPPEVFNLSESFLMFTVTLPGLAANYIWTYEDTIGEISHIQFYAGSNQYIVDVDNLQNYGKIIFKKEQSYPEYMSQDALNSCGAVNNLGVLGNMRNTSVIPFAPAATNIVPSSLTGFEPQYFSVGTIDGAVTYNVMFPLKMIKNTLFAMDKNVYFGQVTYMKIYFGPLSKIAGTSGSPLGPSVLANIAYANPVQPTITQVQLMLAIESNPDIRTSMINKVASSGQQLYIPYVQAYKNSGSGASQNISIQFDIGNGRSLQKVIHSPFSSVEAGDTAYDNSNVDPLLYGTGAAFLANIVQKVTQYYTQLNGRRLQDITILCTAGYTPATNTYVGPGLYDYLLHKKQLRGSVMMNANIYQFNWFHCDDFAEWGSYYDQGNQAELLSGLPMGPLPLTWTFVGSMTASYPFNHYTWAVFTKLLTMSPQLITVV